MNEFETLTRNPKGNACYLMECCKFPKKIISEFKKDNIIYMSLPNGHITTELPEIVKYQINQMKPKKLVYHVIVEYSSMHYSFTSLMYHLLIAENNMEILTRCLWLPAYTVNCTIPVWSTDNNLRIKHYRKGMKCIESKDDN